MVCKGSLFFAPVLREPLDPPPPLVQRLRVAGNVMSKYTLSCKPLFYNAIEDSSGCYRHQHPFGYLQTMHTAQPVYFLQIGAHRILEIG
jgi:hypothetical protein